MPRASSAAAVASMARSSLWPPALCAQTKLTSGSGGGFRRRLQLVDDPAHDALEQRLARLLLEPHRFARAQAAHDFGARQLEHVLAAAIGEAITRLFRA